MYNSQYYTCEQIDQRLLQGYLDDYNTQTGQSLTKEQFLTKLGSVFAKETVIDNTAVNIGYFVCDTAAGTADKAVTAAGYELFHGGSIKVKFNNRNTAGSATLNINNKGAKALYYGGNPVSASNSWDNGEVVEIYYDGTNYYANNVEGNFKDGIFDISAYNLIEGQPTKYATLAEALGTNGNNIPYIFRKGGMQIKYVSTSDNKYVQYRYMSSSTAAADFTNVANWQGVTDTPMAGSVDMFSSGGASRNIVKPLGISVNQIQLTHNYGFVNENGELITGGSVAFYTDPISINKGDAVVFTTDASSVFSTISKYEIIEGSPIYTVLVKGKLRSIQDSVYIADEDMQIVLSGYDDYYNNSRAVKCIITTDGILHILESDSLDIKNKLGIKDIPKTKIEDGFVQWSDGTVGGNSNFFHTEPISLNSGDRIIARLSASSPFAAIAKYEVVSEVPTYTPLVRGNTTASSIGYFDYIAETSIQVVLSGYSDELPDSLWYIEESDKTLGKIEKRIDKAETRINNIESNMPNINPINIFAAFENIVAVGDSLTYCAVFDGDTHTNPFYPDSYSPGDSEMVNWRQAFNPWPKQIASRSGITNSGIFAVPGYNTIKTWNRFKDLFTMPQDKKSLCIIYLGTNGGLTDTMDVDAPAADVDNYRTAWADNYTGDMCKIIQTFVNFGSKILLILPHDVGGAQADLTTTRNVLKKMATRFGCAYIDDEKIYNSDSKYHLYSDLSGSNSLHYNDLGYAYFASSLIFETRKMETNNMKYIIP